MGIRHRSGADRKAGVPEWFIEGIRFGVKGVWGGGPLRVQGLRA